MPVWEFRPQQYRATVKDPASGRYVSVAKGCLKMAANGDYFCNNGGPDQSEPATRKRPGSWLTEGGLRMQQQRTMRDPWERFWERVEEVPADWLSPNGWRGCWLWRGSMTGQGYGRMSIGRQGAAITHLAHRLAYEWVVGQIPSGLVIDHLCRDRACVNPAHLEPVTDRENLLRGEGWSGQHARKTHCPAGHRLGGRNLSKWHLKHGQRKCATCHAAREAARRAAKAAA